MRRNAPGLLQLGPSASMVADSAVEDRDLERRGPGAFGGGPRCGVVEGPEGPEGPGRWKPGVYQQHLSKNMRNMIKHMKHVGKMMTKSSTMCVCVCCLQQRWWNIMKTYVDWYHHPRKLRNGHHQHRPSTGQAARVRLTLWGFRSSLRIATAKFPPKKLRGWTPHGNWSF